MSRSDLQASQCDIYNTVRAPYSSLIQATSWSLGVGADREELTNLTEQSNTSTSVSTSVNLNPSNECGSAVLHYFPKLEVNIPTAYLTRKSPSTSSYHVYQVKIRTKSGIEWSVYRRYSQFHSFHQQLKATKEPIISQLDFPPKRRLNSRASTIVQERRRKLEEYLRGVAEHVERLPAPVASVHTQQLEELLTTHVAASSPQPSHSSSTPSVDTDRSVNQTTLDCSLHDEDRDTINSEHLEDVEDDVEQTSSRTSFTEANDVRSLFYNFISTSSKKEEELDPSMDSFNSNA